jgi:hypothetical protein
MLLILSNSKDATTDYLANVLKQKGVKHLRFNTDRSLENARFQYEVGQPRLRLDDKWYVPSEFTNVWYRRPERLKCSHLDESVESNLALDEWAESLEAFLSHIPVARWMNHPSANVAASHKLQQLTIASNLGFLIPNTLVTQDPAELQDFFRRVQGRVIVKPLSAGYLERPNKEMDTLIYTNRVDEQHLGDLSDLSGCPTLFQEEIIKSSDIRITVVDGHIHAAELKASDLDGVQRCDIRRNNMSDVVHRAVGLPDAIERDIHKLTAHYGLRYAAIDMAVTTKGDWVFFEINPNGQWAWMDLAGATNIAESFVRSFTDQDS